MHNISWRAGAVLIAAILLSGCAGQDDAKKQVRESEGYFKEGVSFLTTDQQKAYVSFQRAVQMDPNNFDAHYALGNLYFQRKHYADAEREFQACVELNPQSGESLNYLGRVLIMEGKNREAIAVLKKATTLPLYSTPDVAYTDLASVLEREGDIAGAIAAYQEALKVDPPNIWRSFIYLSVGRLHLQQGDATKARVALTQATQMDPEGQAGAEASRLMKDLK
jgi:type IV pilus assembly protein PilF